MGDTEEQFRNLSTGQTVTNNRKISSNGGGEDHVRAKSVTTRSGVITEDHQTGESLATMELKTQVASVVTSKDGSEEQRVTIQSDGDPIDHDEALAQAIQEATAMNPDFTVEKIEINQTTQE